MKNLILFCSLLFLNIVMAFGQIETPSNETRFFLPKNGSDKRSTKLYCIVDSKIQNSLGIYIESNFNDEYEQEAAIALQKKVMKISGFSAPVINKGSHSLNKIVFVRDNSIINPRGFTIKGNTKEGKYQLQFSSSTSIGLLYSIEYFNLNLLDFFEGQPSKRIIFKDSNFLSGEVYSKRNKIYIPDQVSIINPGPAFDLRIWTGESSFNRSSWLQDKAKGFEIGTQLYQYHHNLFDIFDSKQKGWQPVFSSDESIEKTKKYVRDFFNKNPSARSVSLSINDGSEGYNSEDFNALFGEVSVTESYSKYVNIIAKYVAQNWPGKKVAILQYSKVSQPPKSPYNSNVIVFLVNDVYANYEKWNNKASNFGLYIYLREKNQIFSSYKPNQTKRLIKWAQEKNINLFKGEFYGSWALDGLQLWLLSNLLWNPDGNIEKITDYYIQKQYGMDLFPVIKEIFRKIALLNDRRYSDLSILSTKPKDEIFNKIDEKDVSFLKDKLSQARKVKNLNKFNDFNLGNLENSLKWFFYYFDTYSKIKLLDNVRNQEDGIKIINNIISRIEGETQFFNEKMKGLAPFAIYTDNFEKVKPYVQWDDAEENIRQYLDKVNMEVASTNRKNYWMDVNNKYPILEKFVTKYTSSKASNKISKFIYEEDFTNFKSDKLQNFDKKSSLFTLSKFIKRSAQSNYRVVNEGNNKILLLNGIGDFIGLYLKLQLDPRKVYKISFSYKQLDSRDNQFTLAISGLSRQREISHSLSNSKSVWQQASFNFSFDSDFYKDPKRQVSLILGLNNTYNLSTQLFIDNLKIEEF